MGDFSVKHGLQADAKHVFSRIAAAKPGQIIRMTDQEMEIVRKESMMAMGAFEEKWKTEQEIKRYARVALTGLLASGHTPGLAIERAWKIGEEMWRIELDRRSNKWTGSTNLEGSVSGASRDSMDDV